jgi:hypothetical protein
VRTGTDVSWNAGVDPTATLPLDVATVVKIEAVGQTVRISYNNNEVASDVLPGTRLSGFANLYVAKHAAPNALFGKFDIQPVAPASFLTTVGQIQSRYAGVFNVPADYSVSFEITPKSTSSGWSNVLWLMGVFDYNLA